MRLMLLLLAGAASAANAQTALDDYVALATGSFDSAAQAARDSRYDTAIWHIAEAPALAGDGQRWLYAENWIQGSDKPYRQRLVRLRSDNGGVVLAASFRLPEPEAYIGAWQSPAAFDGFDIDTLTGIEGCESVITRAGAQRFESTTQGHQCKNSYKGAAYVLSRSVLTAGKMVNWDRGFSTDGELVWGPAAGGYEFLRRGTAAADCNEPVRMLVYGRIFDREAFGAYARALAESGLYPRHDGYYEAITPALDVFEGDPPADRGVVIARFPCLAAAQSFWNSPEYRDIVPLRDGIAEFEVIVMPGLPVPEYID
ncbi:MAG: CpcT/CpeT family chromophore lyase [Pseudomonadota bacterium]